MRLRSVEIDTPAPPAYIRWERRAREKMTKGTFGESLKREREMRGVSLDEISAATRIATRFLQAIENEQWDQLPGGVFNRGFVRAVAHYLGLDEENIVAEYVLAAGDRQSVPVWTGSPPAVTPEQPWLAWIVVAIVIVGLVAGGWFGARRFLAWRAARNVSRSTAVSAAPSPVEPDLPANQNPSATPDDTVPSPVPASEAPSGATDSAPATSAISPTISQVTPQAAAPFEVKIAADKKTKVTVEADSKRVFDGTMKSGENHSFKANDRFEISARDAGALQLELNGKPVAPIGLAGHSGKATFTREALKGASGGGN
jgi:cytoskeleton protein RodZ